jgi:hypothetical protein
MFLLLVSVLLQLISKDLHKDLFLILLIRSQFLL